jgi:hypothetical protein
LKAVVDTATVAETRKLEPSPTMAAVDTAVVSRPTASPSSRLAASSVSRHRWPRARRSVAMA